MSGLTRVVQTAGQTVAGDVARAGETAVARTDGAVLPSLSHIKVIHPEAVQLDGELWAPRAVLNLPGTRYVDRTPSEQRALSFDFDLGKKTAGPGPQVLDPQLSAQLKAYLAYGDSSLHAFEARNLAAKLGLGLPVTNNARTDIEAGARVLLRVRGSDGLMHDTRGIVVSADRNGIHVLGVNDQNQFNVFRWPDENTRIVARVSRGAGGL